MTRTPIDRSPDSLLPSFRKKVEELIVRMEARGYQCRVWETGRDAKRARWLQRRGKSKSGVKSLHCYGAAADIIHVTDLWSNRGFFRALGEEAQALGLTWGGDWDDDPSTPNRFYDGPHVQCVALRQQDEFRALPAEERDAYVAKHLGMTDDRPEREAVPECTDDAPAAPKRKRGRKKRSEDGEA